MKNTMKYIFKTCLLLMAMNIYGTREELEELLDYFDKTAFLTKISKKDVNRYFSNPITKKELPSFHAANPEYSKMPKEFFRCMKTEKEILASTANLPGHLKASMQDILGITKEEVFYLYDFLTSDVAAGINPTDVTECYEAMFAHYWQVVTDEKNHDEEKTEEKLKEGFDKTRDMVSCQLNIIARTCDQVDHGFEYKHSDLTQLGQAWIAQYKTRLQRPVNILDKFATKAIEFFWPDFDIYKHGEARVFLTCNLAIATRLFQDKLYISYHSCAYIPRPGQELDYGFNNILGKRKASNKFRHDSRRATDFTLDSNYVYQASIMTNGIDISHQPGVMLSTTTNAPNQIIFNFYTGNVIEPYFASYVNALVIECERTYEIMQKEDFQFIPLPDNSDYVLFELLVIDMLLKKRPTCVVEELDDEAEETLEPSVHVESHSSKKTDKRKAKQALKKEYQKQTTQTKEQKLAQDARYAALQKRKEELEKELLDQHIQEQIAQEQKEVTKKVGKDYTQTHTKPIATPAKKDTAKTTPSAKKGKKADVDDELLDELIANNESSKPKLAEKKIMDEIYRSATIKFGTLVKALNMLTKNYTQNMLAQVLGANSDGSHRILHTEFGLFNFVIAHGGRELRANRALNLLHFVKHTIMVHNKIMTQTITMQPPAAKKFEELE